MYLLSRTPPSWRRICSPRLPISRLDGSSTLRGIPSEAYTSGSAFHSLSAGAEIIDAPAIGAEPVEIACTVPSPPLPTTRAVSALPEPGAVFDDAQPDS